MSRWTQAEELANCLWLQFTHPALQLNLNQMHCPHNCGTISKEKLIQSSNFFYLNFFCLFCFCRVISKFRAFYMLRWRTVVILIVEDCCQFNYVLIARQILFFSLVWASNCIVLQYDHHPPPCFSTPIMLCIQKLTVRFPHKLLQLWESRQTSRPVEALSQWAARSQWRLPPAAAPAPPLTLLMALLLRGRPGWEAERCQCSPGPPLPVSLLHFPFTFTLSSQPWDLLQCSCFNFKWAFWGLSTVSQEKQLVDTVRSVFIFFYLVLFWL